MTARPTFLLWLAALSPAIALEPPKPAFYHHLPAQLDGWKKTGPESFLGRELYRFIDGGAELYLSFSRLAFLERVSYCKGQECIEVDAFDMKRPENAFGVFSLTREKVEKEFGQGSEYREGLLVFWKGRFYFSLTAYPQTPAKKEAMWKLARILEKAAGVEGQLPPLIELLPPQGLRPASVRYFRHRAWLSTACGLDEGNPLQIKPGHRVALADYDGGHRLLLVGYGSEARAARAANDFRKWLAARKFSGEDAACGRSAAAAAGRTLYVVLRAADDRQAEEILEAILAGAKK